MNIFRNKSTMAIFCFGSIAFVSIMSFFGMQLFSPCMDDNYVQKYEMIGWVQSACPIEEFTFGKG